MSDHTDLQSLKQYTADDRFNYIHRHDAGLDRHYAVDLDLVLIEKHPVAHIPGFIEFKNESEPIRYTQAVLFSQLSEIAPVYVVYSQVDMLNTPPTEHRFTVRRFDGVDDLAPTPPIVNLTTIAECLPWGGRVDYQSGFGWEESGGDGLIGWEEELRNQRFEQSADAADSEVTTLSDFLTATNA